MKLNKRLFCQNDFLMQSTLINGFRLFDQRKLLFFLKPIKRRFVGHMSSFLPAVGWYFSQWNCYCPNSKPKKTHSVRSWPLCDTSETQHSENDLEFTARSRTETRIQFRESRVTKSSEIRGCFLWRVLSRGFHWLYCDQSFRFVCSQHIVFKQKLVFSIAFLSASMWSD